MSAPDGVDPETGAEVDQREVEAMIRAGIEGIGRGLEGDELTKFIAKAGRAWRLENRPTTVYRFLDADENVLRVGCTCDLNHRIRQYRYENPPWWARVVTVVHQEYSRRSVALAAEKNWLRTWQPEGNQLLHPVVTDYERTPEGAAATATFGTGLVLEALMEGAFGADLEGILS